MLRSPFDESLYERDFVLQSYSILNKIYKLMDIDKLVEYSNLFLWEFDYIDNDGSSSIRHSLFDSLILDGQGQEHFTEKHQIQYPIQELSKTNKDDLIQHHRHEQQELSDTSRSQSIYHPKKQQQAKIRQYPTKNMLPAIMPLLRQYLESNLPSSILMEFQVYRDIKAKKNRLNLQTFVDLFRVQEFRPIFAKYFREKRIYRDLMKLRIKYPRKLYYFKRIDIFQQAFLTLKFDKIN